MDDLVNIRRFLQKYEAEIAKGLLAQEGIESIISADDCGGYRPHLTLGVDGIRLLVKKEDAGKAEEILKTVGGDFNSAGRRGSTTATSKSSFWGGVVLGLFAGLIFALLFNTTTKKQKVRPTSWDTNGDGKKDTWAEYSNGKPVIYIYDQNFDGKTDSWGYFKNGLIIRDESDLNRDGQIDGWRYYEPPGEISQIEYDLNHDGKVDCWEFFKKGERFKVTLDNDHDGNIDEWGLFEGGSIKERKWSFQNDNIVDKKAFYEDGRKIKEMYDRNRDGNFDEEVVLDEFERVIKVNKI